MRSRLARQNDDRHCRGDEKDANAVTSLKDTGNAGLFVSGMGRADHRQTRGGEGSGHDDQALGDP